MKKFLVRFDGDSPLWRKFQKWMKEEHQVEMDSLCLPIGCCVGMLNDTAIFVDNEEGNMTSAPVITLEKWDRLVNGFVLPEKWCIKVNGSYKVNPEVYKWRNMTWYQRGYSFIDCERTWTEDRPKGYTEITLEQFKKYVLKGPKMQDFQAPEGSLVVSPLAEKGDNLNLFNKWFKDTYGGVNPLEVNFEGMMGELRDVSILPPKLSAKDYNKVTRWGDKINSKVGFEWATPKADHSSISKGRYFGGVDLANGSNSSAGGTYEDLLDWAKREQNSLLYGTPYYSIEDLSEGRVALINDGNIDELTTVLKAAFPNDSAPGMGSHKYYNQIKRFPNLWGGNNKTKLPTQSVKEFYKQLKTENIDNRFPFRLTEKDAKRIVEAACRGWRSRLSDKWGAELLRGGFVNIEEEYYKYMRKACTEEQNVLFDEIFGKDEEQFKAGDWITYIGSLSSSYTTKIQSVDKDGWIESDVNKPEEEVHYHYTQYRKATPEEIAKAQCPYEDGELCWVKDNPAWALRYATGKTFQGKPTFYMDQHKGGSEKIWEYHKSAKGVELPKD